MTSERPPARRRKLALLLGAAWLGAGAAPADDGRLFVVARAETREHTERMRLRGVVNFKDSVEVRSTYGARIRRFAVVPGDTVKEGDLLAEVDTVNEQSTLEFYEQFAKIQLSNVETARLGVDLRMRAFDRTSQLVERGLAAPAELDKANAAVESERALLKQTLVQLEETLKGRELAAGRVRNSSFLAPLGGLVVEMQVNPKQVVGTFQAMSNFLVARIAKPGTYRLQAKALAAHHARLRASDKCQVSIPGRATLRPCKLIDLARFQRKPEQPRNFYAPPQEVGNAFDVTAEFTLDGVLPPNLEVELILSRPSAIEGVAVPLDAVVSNSRGDFVDVAAERPDGTLAWERRPVRALASGETYAIVEGGIAAGDRVKVRF